MPKKKSGGGNSPIDKFLAKYDIYEKPQPKIKKKSAPKKAAAPIEQPAPPPPVVQKPIDHENNVFNINDYRLIVDDE